MFRAGIVGLPNAGKSTLFNALTRGHVAAAAHPFTTVDPNVGDAALADERLARLGEVLRPGRLVPAHVRYVDIAGLVRGAHRGEGLGNRFLGHIREVDAVAVVLRAFASASSPHPEGDVDPVRDLDLLLMEMALADLETASEATPRAGKRAAATKDDRARALAEALERALRTLEAGRPLGPELSADDVATLREIAFLTAKPLLVVLNVDEADAGRADEVEEAFQPSLPAGAEAVAVCAKLEEEVEDLSPGDASELLREFGVEQRGTERLADATRRLLRLITFYSIESSECRAWLVREGTRAQGAAAEIHTDMARGFIRADVIPAEGLIETGSIAAAREHGLVRSEGRDYVVRDGDVLTFRFRG